MTVGVLANPLMSQFPSLNREDIDHIDAVLRDLLKKSEANIALLVEKAGYLIHQCGNPEQLDTTTFATLGSNAYNAVQFMASLVNESNFTSMYQQGENYSTLMLNIDENSLLVIVFPTHLTIGSMKYYAGPAVKTIADRIQVSSQRGDTGLDLSDLNPIDVQSLFQKKD
jgi:predicted regulator of Ras-like GTPase activity (Roadblock/LC7/MglB family)